MSKETKTMTVSGKRKRAIAKASIKKGTGKVMVNGISLDQFQPELARLKIKEPLVIAGEKAAKGVDISVRISGGGIMGQADAARLAIGKSLVAFYKDQQLEKDFLSYDRTLLVADVRRKEVCKPNDSKARAKRQKSYR